MGKKQIAGNRGLIDTLNALNKHLEKIEKRFCKVFDPAALAIEGETRDVCEAYLNVLKEHIPRISGSCKELQLEPLLSVNDFDCPHPIIKVYELDYQRHHVVAANPATFSSLHKSILLCVKYLRRKSNRRNDVQVIPLEYTTLQRMRHSGSGPEMVVRKEAQKCLIDDDYTLKLIEDTLRSDDPRLDTFSKVINLTAQNILVGNLVLSGSFQEKKESLILVARENGCSLSPEIEEWAVSQGIIVPSARKQAEIDNKEIMNLGNAQKGASYYSNLFPAGVPSESQDASAAMTEPTKPAEKHPATRNRDKKLELLKKSVIRAVEDHPEDCGRRNGKFTATGIYEFIRYSKDANLWPLAFPKPDKDGGQWKRYISDILKKHDYFN